MMQSSTRITVPTITLNVTRMVRLTPIQVPMPENSLANMPTGPSKAASAQSPTESPAGF